MDAKLCPVDYEYIKSIKKGSELHFLAGACPLDATGRVPYPDDFVRQAGLCPDNALTVLQSKGMTLENVCFVRVLVASAQRADLVAVWQRLRELVPDMPPATLQGVTVLGYRDQLVELEIVAASD
jgi:enamine deaminase RidA (YjgF/YER057c/UK114 family)